MKVYTTAASSKRFLAEPEGEHVAEEQYASPATQEYRFYGSCIMLTSDEVSALRANAAEVTRGQMVVACPDVPAFLKERGLVHRGRDHRHGYSPIHYYRSRVNKLPAYYLTHSGIEYVWIYQTTEDK